MTTFLGKMSIHSVLFWFSCCSMIYWTWLLLGNCRMIPNMLCYVSLSTFSDSEGWCILRLTHCKFHFIENYGKYCPCTIYYHYLYLQSPLSLYVSTWMFWRNNVVQALCMKNALWKWGCHSLMHIFSYEVGLEILHELSHGETICDFHF
jgi:hypothetical protein